MKAAFSAPNIKHLHISYVQVGPDFIHRREPQFAGIQDELQLFNGYSVLLPVAPGHIFPSRELLQQTLTVPAACAQCLLSITAWTAEWETPAGGCLNAAQLQI